MVKSFQAEGHDPGYLGLAKHIIKGGSYLCAKNHCSRYRPAAREAEETNTGTSHIGFRLVVAASNKKPFDALFL